MSGDVAADMTADVAQAIARVRERVARAADEAGRDPAEVALLLAVKTVPAERVRAAIAAGERLLGQNRAQELTALEPAIADLPHATHFIGHLQSNKVGAVTRWVTCVQTVDGISLAERLDRARRRLVDDGGVAGLLDVLVQVNTSGEPTKSGVPPEAAAELAGRVAGLGALRLRGFMTIGANSPDPRRVRASYDALAQVREDVVRGGGPGTADARELSMGMSGDLEVAIAAGATQVRVGSAVFGARPPRPVE